MELPKRKPNRLANFDYSSSNYYFITICTHEKKCIFGKVNELNSFGKIARKNIEKINDIFPSVSVDQYAVMPNHIHMILALSNLTEKTPNISTVIGQYKMSVTKEIRQSQPNLCVWQRSFHDHIIRNEKSYLQIWEYVTYNDQKWSEDCYYVIEE